MLEKSVGNHGTKAFRCVYKRRLCQFCDSIVHLNQWFSRYGTRAKKCPAMPQKMARGAISSPSEKNHVFFLKLRNKAVKLSYN